MVALGTKPSVESLTIAINNNQVRRALSATGPGLTVTLLLEVAPESP